MHDDTYTNLTLLEGGRFTAPLAWTSSRDTIVHVVGTRPNFVKMAPVITALERRGAFRQVVVHTGQHYDVKMSDEVLADLDFPAPDRFLRIGSGAHGAQTSKVMLAFEEV